MAMIRQKKYGGTLLYVLAFLWGSRVAGVPIPLASSRHAVTPIYLDDKHHDVLITDAFVNQSSSRKTGSSLSPAAHLGRRPRKDAQQQTTAAASTSVPSLVGSSSAEYCVDLTLDLALILQGFPLKMNFGGKLTVHGDLGGDMNAPGGAITPEVEFTGSVAVGLYAGDAVSLVTVFSGSLLVKVKPENLISSGSVLRALEAVARGILKVKAILLKEPELNWKGKDTAVGSNRKWCLENVVPDSISGTHNVLYYHVRERVIDYIRHLIEKMQGASDYARGDMSVWAYYTLDYFGRRESLGTEWDVVKCDAVKPTGSKPSESATDAAKIEWNRAIGKYALCFILMRGAANNQALTQSLQRGELTKSLIQMFPAAFRALTATSTSQFYDGMNTYIWAYSQEGDAMDEDFHPFQQTPAGMLLAEYIANTNEVKDLAAAKQINGDRAVQIKFALSMGMAFGNGFPTYCVDGVGLTADLTLGVEGEYEAVEIVASNILTIKVTTSDNVWIQGVVAWPWIYSGSVGFALLPKWKGLTMSLKGLYKIDTGIKNTLVSLFQAAAMAQNAQAVAGKASLTDLIQQQLNKMCGPSDPGLPTSGGNKAKQAMATWLKSWLQTQMLPAIIALTGDSGKEIIQPILGNLAERSFKAAIKASLGGGVSMEKTSHMGFEFKMERKDNKFEECSIAMIFDDREVAGAKLPPGSVVSDFTFMKRSEQVFKISASL